MPSIHKGRSKGLRPLCKRKNENNCKKRKIVLDFFEIVHIIIYALAKSSEESA